MCVAICAVSQQMLSMYIFFLHAYSLYVKTLLVCAAACRCSNCVQIAPWSKRHTFLLAADKTLAKWRLFVMARESCLSRFRG